MSKAPPDAWKFPSPAARLYHLIGVENAVRTPRGIGTLKKAHSYPGGCQVVLLHEKERVKNSNAKRGERVMRCFNHEEVVGA